MKSNIFLNQKFGKLSVIEKTNQRSNKGEILWKCLCDCGNFKLVNSYSLKAGFTKSCGCLNKLKIEINQRFGKLTAVDPSGNKDGYGYWNFLCDCGNSKIINISSVINGYTESCGCIKSPDLSNKIFGNLVVIRQDGVSKEGQKKWLCQCFCGKLTSVRANSLIKKNGTRSCGCLVSLKGKSKTIHFIKDKSLIDVLKEKNIPYANSLRIFKKSSEADFSNYIESFESNITNIEMIFQNKLNLIKFDKKILNNHVYRPDFQLNKDLYLNADGIYWHSEEYKDKNYHLKLRVAFESENKRIMQFYEDEIYNKWPIVESIIKNAENKTSNRIFARKTELKQILNKDAALFFNTNHLMGHHKSSKCIGLYHNDQLVCCLSYRINKKKGFAEIARFGSLIDTSVIGGFSKLLKELEKITKENSLKKIISFCDLRYATGKSYDLNGFTREKITLGWCWGNSKCERFNRLMCRASLGKTEKENALKRKWFKIYDAGQAKYVKNISTDL